MLKWIKEFLKSLRMRFLSPVFIAINEWKDTEIGQWAGLQASINELHASVRELREAEIQQWDKLQVFLSGAFLDLQNRLSEIEQINRDSVQRYAVVETRLSGLYEYAEKIESWTKLFEDYLRTRESNTENRFDCILQKMDHVISLHSDMREILLYTMKPMLYRVTSFLQNTATEFTEICNSEKYRYLKKLHELTKVEDVKGESKLVRIGKAYDGGYVMVEPFSAVKIAYSVGIANDVSWDKDMVRRGYQIFQYDHTIQALPEEDQNFHWKKIGLGGQDCGDIKTLKSVLAENGHLNASGILLKMDIEGGEWEVINSCPEDILGKFDQIVLEVHDLIVPADEMAVINALRILNKTHFVAHIHGNNYSRAEYYGDLFTPDVLEITYVNRSRYQYEDKKKTLPLEIDTPNNTSVPEIQLGNW